MKIPQVIPFHFQMHHLDMIIFGCVCLAFVVFHISKWEFISKCLSDGATPSGFRLMGYYVIITICLGELYTIFKTEKIDTHQLGYLILLALVLLGFIKAIDALSVIRGNNMPPAVKDEDKPPTP